MNIQRVDRLRNHGIFRDFTWPTDLAHFANFNVIYGWNGSGKTTISRIFRDLELRREPAPGEVNLTVDGQGIRATEFEAAAVPVRVFNRDFVAENVFPMGGGDVPPILILGEENIKKQKQLEEFRAEMAEVRTALEAARNDKSEAERALDNHCVNGGRLIRDLLRGSAGNPYNNYDKRNYTRRSEVMIADGDCGSYRITDPERDELVLQHRAPIKSPVEEIAYEEPDFAALRTKTADLLSTSVVAKTIQSLSHDIQLSDWVRHGLDLHRERGADECLFCERPLSADRISDLEQHFNDAYQDLVDALDELGERIDDASETLSTFVPPNAALFNERFADGYEVALKGLATYRTQVTEYLSSLADAVSNKRTNPFGCVLLSIDNFPIPDNQPIGNLNIIIQEHNSECANHTEVISKARERLEDGTVAERLDEFRELQDAISSHESAVQKYSGHAQKLSDTTSKLEAALTEHRAPAQELNDDLRKYMGHDELQLDIKDHGYSISRNGVPASQLSEGETTAIALLYFLKSLTDRRFDFANGVVVLDDPISSLDSNSLFSAFGLIKNRTKDAGQLFILTHNFTFFRQVRNWFRHLPGQRRKDVATRPARFYMLGCASDHNGRYSHIQALDPLLERFESDYHYLFASVVQGASSATTHLEANYLLPNMARRLLEPVYDL
jgi:wobble nucleotide-excising tRNase